MTPPGLGAILTTSGFHQKPPQPECGGGREAVLQVMLENRWGWGAAGS